MDKYKQQQQHEPDFRRRRSPDEGRGTKMKKEKDKTDNDNDSSGTNSNSTTSFLRKQPQSHGGIGGGSRGRSHRAGFDPLTDDNLLYKTSIRGPNLQPQRSVNEKKAVNWRLACFMCNEYLTRGTLLGSPWPPQDSNPNGQQNNDESRRDKERLYHTLTDFVQAGDVHLPGIVNPSQLAAWLGLKQ